MMVKKMRMILLLSLLAPAALPGQTRRDAEKGRVVQEARQVVGQPANKPELAEPKGRSGKRLAITPRTKSAPGQKAPIRFGPGQHTIKTVLGSLAVVLGSFFLLAWFLKRNRGGGQQALPKEVIEILGRVPLAGKQQMQLVRVGGKLILLCVSASGAETLTEITDPLEVERLSGACQATQPNSVSSSFRQVLEQFGKEPANGFLDTEPITESTGRRGRQGLSVET